MTTKLTEKIDLLAAGVDKNINSIMLTIRPSDLIAAYTQELAYYQELVDGVMSDYHSDRLDRLNTILQLKRFRREIDRIREQYAQLLEASSNIPKLVDQILEEDLNDS